ncbi:PIR protein, putative [Plasmodium sp.]|nr:PIR protein, putative [Plasmodium sp.]
MKLRYTKILLFYLPLNILVSSSYEHNKNNPYSTERHIRTPISRVLSECDIQTSIYDDDTEMKSVKEIFDRQMSQRFEEYDERMKDKRQKCKEQCDKDIQEIIVKDKIDKSLAEKVEKGCLKCGCGLGGVAASVGIIGPIAISEVKKAALVAAAQKGIAEGIEAAIKGVKGIWGLAEVESVNFGELVTATNFSDQNLLGHALQTLGNEICVEGGAGYNKSFCLLADVKYGSRFAQGIAQQARAVAQNAGKVAKSAGDVEISLANSTSFVNFSFIIQGYYDN